MELDATYKRHILYFFFESKKSAVAAAREINIVHGENFISERTAQKWFQRFRAGDFSVEDRPRSGRPVEFDNAVLAALVENEPTLTVDEISERLGSSHGTVHRHLMEIGKVSKLGKWVPHDLSEVNKQHRIHICSSLLSRHAKEPLLDRIVTGDEKWILYKNVVRKRQWCDKDSAPGTTSKPDLHPRKVLLSVWWDKQGVIFSELLPPNVTINAKVYGEQLDRLKAELIKNRPALVNRKKVLFHHDNARPHTAKMTKDKLEDLGWEIMPHPPYSPDLAPSDYHLYRSLQNFLNGKTFQHEEDVKTAVTEFFNSKPQIFYSDGINKLPERWRAVVNNDGQYIID